jgi:hypothetical protein
VTIFTPAEEAKNGADWYWRIQRGSDAIHAQVQAKRVQRSEFGQSDSDGQIEFDAGQLDRLVNARDSAQRSLPGLQVWVSTFARYDATPPGSMDPWDCEKHACNRECESKKLVPSIWIAQAENFRNLRRWSIIDVIEKSLRLDCILPCIDNGNGGFNAKGFSLRPDPPPFEECLAAIQSTPTLIGEFEGAIQIKI